MVDTRNASLALVTTDSFQEKLEALQEAMKNMITQQQLVNAELAALKYSEGTSTNIGSHTNNTHYERMTKIEFPRFNGDDVKWLELNEAYVVSLFIGGLKNEVSMPIRMFTITHLTDVYAMAKMQEATNAVLKPRYNLSLLPTLKFVPNSVNKSVDAPLKSATMNG
nr:reverse transcriptase [Tanacetum cinerariifolium]